MEWDLDSRYSVSESKHFPSEGTLPNVAPSAPSKEEAADTPENLARRELCQVDAVPSYVLSLATSPLTNWGHFSPDGRGTPTATDQGALGGEGSLASRPVKGCCLSVATVPGLPSLWGSCPGGQALPKGRSLSGGGGAPSVR